MARWGPALRWPAYVSPLWHGVELNRAATLGAATQWPIAVHVGYLVLFAAAGAVWASIAFRRQLQD